MRDTKVTARTRSGLSLKIPALDVLPAVEIFALHDYDIPLIRWEDVRSVVDCGANVGAFSAWVARKSPCRVLAVEPNPRTFALLRENLAGLGDRVSLLQAALASGKGSRTLYGVAETSATSFFGDRDDLIGRFEVQALTLDDVLDHGGFTSVDLLKMDVEGAEQEVFAALSPVTLRRIRSAIIEFHAIPGNDVSLIEEKLRDGGLQVVREDRRGTSLLVARRV